MITKDTQVRLTIELEGRLGAKASNANIKKERRLASILERKGKQFYSDYINPEYQSCSQTVMLSAECVKYFASEEGKPARTAPSEWKKLKPLGRLERNLQIYADYIAAKTNVKFSYTLIN